MFNKRRLVFIVTSCNDVCSEIAPVSIGVARSSILGPLLFILYMNDLPDVLQFCHVTLYADDTVLYLKPPNLLRTCKARLMLT